ncbi:hypothetical protein GCM10023321_61320 [Pseudonocardia eucalypti]|uniref:LppM domain-containing protein n=1 Tax=Pseudonocardia eucalypti TaxID=648755 RepID=A0ABP9QV60_9PSEU
MLVLVAVLAVLALAGGCTRVRTALAVQGDDTVAGEIVIGVAGGSGGPAVVIPPALAGRVSVRPYQADGYQGTQLGFTGLTLDEVNSLASIVPPASGRFHFALRRAGGALLLNGQVDLTALPVDGADVQLKVAFPGEVVGTDGQRRADTVSWAFTPGQVSEFTATVNAPDPGAPSVGRWALVVVAVLLIASAGVVLLAKANRNPPARRRPRR